MAAVPKDTTSGRWMPATLADVTMLYSGRTVSIPTPTAGWQLQEAAGNNADFIGTDALVPSSMAYNQTKAGWTRKSMVATPEGGGRVLAGTNTYATSSSLLMMGGLQSNPSANRVMAYFQGATISIDSSGHAGISDSATAVFSFGSLAMGTTVHPLILTVNSVGPAARLYTDQETISGPTITFDAANKAYLGNPGFGLGSPAFDVNFGLLFPGVLSATQAAIIIDSHINGPAVASVSVVPSSVILGMGSTQQLTATATRVDGTTFDCTSTAVWLSSNPGVVTVSSTGLATGVSAGSSTITATYTSFSTTPAIGSVAATGLGNVLWPYTMRLPEFRTTIQRAGFIEVVLSATPASAEWTSLDLWVSGGSNRAPSRNRS